jgi:hypothetical protein
LAMPLLAAGGAAFSGSGDFSSAMRVAFRK